MHATPPFAEAVRVIATGLCENAPSYRLLNHAANQIDHLGRKLHGLGLAHEREIAACFTAAIGELGACHTLPEEKRSDPVGRAIRHLEVAMERMHDGQPAS